MYTALEKLIRRAVKEMAGMGLLGSAFQFLRVRPGC